MSLRKVVAASRSNEGVDAGQPDTAARRRNHDSILNPPPIREYPAAPDFVLPTLPLTHFNLISPLPSLPISCPPRRAFLKLPSAGLSTKPSLFPKRFPPAVLHLLLDGLRVGARQAECLDAMLQHAEIGLIGFRRATAQVTDDLRQIRGLVIGGFE